MKIILLLFVINLVIVVRSDTHKSNGRPLRNVERNVEQNVERNVDMVVNDDFLRQMKVPETNKQISKRKPLEFDCAWREVNEEFLPEKCDCKEPCQCLPPNIRKKAFTKVVEQEITARVLLKCTPESFYDNILYEGSYPGNLSCNALFEKCYDDAKDIYTAIRTLPNGKQIVHTINAKIYCDTFATTNGNTLENERAILDDCECKGDVLSSTIQYIAVDPIAGCRACHGENGVQESNAVYYELKIFGKCCSVCYLQSAQNWYSKGIKNH